MSEKHEAALRKLVIANDADQDAEFFEALDEARALLGLRLAPDHEDVLIELDQKEEQAAVRCCVHGKFQMRAPCTLCNPLQRRGI